MPAVPTMINVKVDFDPEARVWYVDSSDLPGLNLEADTFDALHAQIPQAVADLIGEADGSGDFDVPIEIVAHASTMARRFTPPFPAAAFGEL